MELYNPTHVKLPPLKIEKTRQREVIEDDRTVVNFLHSDLLLHGAFNKLYLNIQEKSKGVLELLNQTKEAGFIPIERFRHKTGTKLVPYKLLAFRYLLHKSKSKKNTKELNKLILEAKKEANKETKKKLSILSDEMQNSLSEFEEKHKLELQVLTTTTAHICKKCSYIISLDKFKRCNCTCGEKISKTSQVKELPLHRFNDNLIKFIDMNYWFEHGVDYLLRRKNLSTLVGYYVMGHSSTWHEIDNIAESKNENYRFFCECKNSEVKVKDIFIFSGKMIDIGCTRGYIFTTAKNVSTEIARLARSKNITIIEGALTRNERSLLQEIKES